MGQAADFSIRSGGKVHWHCKIEMGCICCDTWKKDSLTEHIITTIRLCYGDRTPEDAKLEEHATLLPNHSVKNHELFALTFTPTRCPTSSLCKPALRSLAMKSVQYSRVAKYPCACAITLR